MTPNFNLVNPPYDMEMPEARNQALLSPDQAGTVRVKPCHALVPGSTG